MSRPDAFRAAQTLILETRMNVLLIETIALIGATVHTMEPAADGAAASPAAVMTVLIEDGLILDVGADLDVPEEATVVDLAGLHLIPGLIDAHVTFDPEHDALYLASGVTSVRDAGSPIGSMVTEATADMRDRHPGPGLVVSSPVFVAPTSARADGFVLGAPETAANQLDELLRLLADAKATVGYFQFDRSLDAATHRVVTATATAYGVEAWGPLPKGLDVATARAAGQRGLLGLDGLLSEGTRFETLEDPTFLTPIARAMGEGDWMVAPLLMGTARILRAGASDEDPEVLEALSPGHTITWSADLEAFRILRKNGALAPVESSLERQRKLVKDMADAGVTLLPASGAPSGGIAPGVGLVDELEEWARAGLTPEHILRLATREAAISIGLGNDHGLIARDHVANLVALAADPRRSISALRNPEVVVIRGSVKERDELDAAVQTVVEGQRAAKAALAQIPELAAPPMPSGEVLLEGTADITAYGSRTSFERYSVVATDTGMMAYGARVRIPATAVTPTRELVLVQLIDAGLVERFDLTLDVLDDKGQPKLAEDGSHAFLASGRRFGDTRKLSIERSRFGALVDAQRAEEAIAAVDGSSAVMGLITAMHFPEGGSFVVAFNGTSMEPIVDRINLRITPEDHRLEMADSRGARIYGFGTGGALLFGARAEGGGRLDVRPGPLPDGDFPGLKIRPERLFVGGTDDTGAETGTPREASAGGEDDR